MTDTIEVRSPIHGTILGTVPNQPPEAVAATVRELREHQREWEAIGPLARAGWLRALREWLLAERDRIADVLQRESGKPRAEAEIELPFVAEAISYFARHAREFLADEPVRPSGLLSAAKRMRRLYRPYPVVGVISPWNFPLLIPGADVITALLAGAAVLLKPSEVTPLTALELQRGWREIGAPPVFAVVTGDGATGAAVVEHVDYVQFTGSTRTGQAIAHRCVDRMIPYSLELGGKDPAIVLADADLDRAVRGIAWGALLNAGQACVSIERVYVEAPLYDRFVANLVDYVAALRRGDDRVPYSVDLGAMATSAQHAIAQRHIDEALDAGARALTGGGNDDNDPFLAPAVLVDVDESMTCLREETFGPTIPVVKVADAAEAIRRANQSKYGLSASVWTRDTARGERIARELEVGAVNINDTVTNLLEMGLPHGGWKQSGSGSRLGGAAGLRKYTRQQAITAPRIRALPWEPLWFPYVPRKARIVRRLLAAVAATGSALLWRTPEPKREAL
ncbi:aldehyde dehydrogenase family protein [Nocardia sp. NPDC046763]|uniref:aldehyde dehydrogenase family protein n=1 Tax=Nocardia sp. NPDC046763 TaxID=3155256 RepID=UPI0033F65C0A